MKTSPRVSPGRSRHRKRWFAALALLCCGCASSGPQLTSVAPLQTSSQNDAATDAAVTVVNASRQTRCAEEDNVYIKLYGAGLRGMRIEARQPSYIAQLDRDDSKADFSDCHFTDDENPVFHFEPKRVTLWEDEHWLLIGNTYASFWRANEVPVVVGNDVTQQLHLLQLHRKDPSEPREGRHEFLVLYPPDGYWRAKPIPASPLPSSTYGSSFLVGPITEAQRPVVEIERVEFVPDALTFKLDYADGSHGSMRLVSVDRERLSLEYHHDRPLPATQPLAAVRSMFVTPDKADVAEVALRETPSAGLRSAAIDSFTQARAVEVCFGRARVSRHNPSAPDMWFGGFELQ